MKNGLKSFILFCSIWIFCLPCTYGIAAEPKQKRAFLGIDMKNGNHLYHQLKPELSDQGAILINRIIIGSAAEKHGLAQGDLIFSINKASLPLNEPLKAFRNRLKTFTAGDKIYLQILRTDKYYQLGSQRFSHLSQAKHYLSQHTHSQLVLEQLIDSQIIDLNLVLGSQSELPMLSLYPPQLASEWKYNNIEDYQSSPSRNLQDRTQNQKPNSQKPNFQKTNSQKQSNPKQEQTEHSVTMSDAMPALLRSLSINPEDISIFLPLIRNDAKQNIPGANPLIFHLQQNPQALLPFSEGLKSIATLSSSELVPQLLNGFYLPIAEVPQVNYSLTKSPETIRKQLFTLLSAIHKQNDSLKTFSDKYANSLSRLKKYYQSQDDQDTPQTDPQFHRELQEIERWWRDHYLSIAAPLINLNRYFSPTRIQGIKQAFQAHQQTKTYQENGLKIVIAGPDNNYHYQGADLILELGGNDSYFVANSEQDKPIIIDLEGNDIYQSQLDHQWGGADTEIAYLLDWSGDDQYFAGDFSLGSAWLGMALLSDRSGDDRYFSMHLSQAAGLIGTGILWDHNGDDNYLSATLSQAGGLFLGEAYLIDSAGNDRYTSSGWVASAYANDSSYDAVSMGVGLGLRGVCRGGFGLLIDISGNDNYHAGNFSLGSGYYFAMGAVMDLAGNDHYSAMRYGIGAAAHSAIGLFYDQSGDDHYQSSQHAIAGAAWDLSLALFIDAQGNDHYRSHGSFSFAAAEHNSLAIHFDHAGNDHYGQSFYTQQNNQYNEGASMGIFVNFLGQDHYPAGFKDQLQIKQNQFYFEDY